MKFILVVRRHTTKKDETERANFENECGGVAPTGRLGGHAAAVSVTQTLEGITVCRRNVVGLVGLVVVSPECFPPYPRSRMGALATNPHHSRCFREA